MPEKFNYWRNDGKDYYKEDDERKIFLNPGNGAKKISAECKNCQPKYASNDIETQEANVIHFSYSCDERGEGSDDWDKARKDDRFSSIPFIELVCFLEIFFFYPFASFDFISKVFSYPVIDGISENCCYGEEKEKKENIHYGF